MELSPAAVLGSGVEVLGAFVPYVVTVARAPTHLATTLHETSMVTSDIGCGFIGQLPSTAGVRLTRCTRDTGTTSFVGWLPNAWTQAPPTTSTPKSPPFACESEPTLTDETAVLDRMTEGENAVATDTATQLWTEWRCTSLTVQRAGVNDDSVYGWVEVCVPW